MAHPSVAALWRRYRAAEGLPATEPVPPAEQFCDSQAEADRCAALVVAGRKRATASALVEYRLGGEALPAPGRRLIVVDWAGLARALIRTTEVEVHRFGDVPAAFAAAEGEGDGSLAWWRDTHRAFWRRTLGAAADPFTDDFLVVCETFELLLTADAA